MTFEQLCESMGWHKNKAAIQLRWFKGSVTADPFRLMAVDNNLTPAGAIAVQTEYELSTEPVPFQDPKEALVWGCFKRGVEASAPDIPTAIRDCAMEIEL